MNLIQFFSALTGLSLNLLNSVIQPNLVQFMDDSYHIGTIV